MRPGDRLADRWEIERRAGAGGMGAVYRARDVVNGEPVAIKVVRAPTDETAARFERESRLLAELEHPAIVRYITHGTLPDVGMYLVTEWLEGEDLAHRLARGRPTIDEALSLCRRVAEALSVAHRHGIIHRDVKPGNVYLVAKDVRQVKLLDFGVARLAAHAVEITSTGYAVGTPTYMSPEQAAGRRNIDARADVYSLGCLLFKCLTGRTPFGGDDAIAVLAKVVLETPPRLRDVSPEMPAALDELIATMLAREPDDRPPDALAVVDAIEALGALSRGTSSPRSDRPPGLTTDERRLICVVVARRALPVADPRGVTPPIDPWAAETERESAVTPLEQRLVGTAQKFGAQLQRLADGSVLITVTGSDVATDLVSRAARAALELREALPGIAIALATGMSESGTAAPVGEVIDRAIAALATHRLRGDVPAPRPIAVDEVSAALLRHRFDIASDAGAPVLGGRRSTFDAPRQLLGRPTMFVGRDREIHALEAMLAECADERAPRAVLVTSPAGGGKTRLRHEFVERIARDERDVELLEASGDAHAGGSPFALLSTALRRRFGLHAGDAPERQHARLATGISDVMIGDDRDRVVTFLAELIGIPLPDTRNSPLRSARQNSVLLGDQMRAAWKDYLSACCAIGPVVIVLDDVQWGDLPSLKFIEAALTTLRGRPVMLAAFARPEVRTAFPGFGATVGLTEIALPSLAPRACERVVRDVLGADCPTSQVRTIVDRAAGNPFYLEELVRAAAAGRLDGMPESVLAATQARIQGLENDARRILRAASVFGPSFWVGGLYAVLGGPTENAGLDGWLRSLVEREWIVRARTSTVRGETEYCFAQSFVCESVYAMLTDDDLERGHRLAAAWLAEHGEHDAMMLAEHFERGADPVHALPYFVDATRQSLAGDDLIASLARAGRGIACAAAAGPTTGRASVGTLQLYRAEAHRCRGENADAARAALEALERLESRSSAWYRAIAESSTAHGRLGDNARLLDHAVALMAPPNDPDAIDAYCIAAGRLSVQLGHAGSHEMVARILDVAESAAGPSAGRDPSTDAAIATARSAQALARTQPSAALAWAMRAAIGLDRAGDRRGACMQRVNVGYGYSELGDYAHAQEWLQSALDAAISMGLDDAAAMARQNLGLTLVRLGDVAEGVRSLSAALEAFGRHQNRFMEGATRVYLAMGWTALGDFDAAETECRAGLEMLGHSLPAIALGVTTLAAVYRAAGRADAANDAALEAMRLFREAGSIEEGESDLRLEHVLALFDRHETEAGITALREAHARIVDAADEISDPELRACYLGNIAANVRTIALAAQWLSG